MDFHITTISNCIVVHMPVRIDHKLSEELLKRITMEAESRPDFAVILDFEDVLSIASSGFGAMIQIQRTLNQTKRTLNVCSLSDKIRGLLDALDFQGTFTVHDTVNDAIALNEKR